MINLFKVNIKNKHDYILFNKDDGKWFSKINQALPIERYMTDDRLTCIDRTLSPFNLKPINSGMGFKEQQRKTSGLANELLYPDKRSYLEAKAKAYKAEQANRKTINDFQHFSSALLERTSEVFKSLTTIQNKSLEQEKEIVTQLKNQNAQIIDPLKAIENKTSDLNLNNDQNARKTMSERLISDPEITSSKN